MKTRKYAIVAAALTLGVAMLVSPGVQAQPLDDRVNVTMPYTTVIGHKTLPPGDYVIQRMPSAGGGGRVLLIYSDKGMKFETSAMTIPCRSEEHTSELQSQSNLVCRLLLEKKKKVDTQALPRL